MTKGKESVGNALNLGATIGGRIPTSLISVSSIILTLMTASCAVETATASQCSVDRWRMFWQRITDLSKSLQWSNWWSLEVRKILGVLAEMGQDLRSCLTGYFHTEDNTLVNKLLQLHSTMSWITVMLGAAILIGLLVSRTFRSGDRDGTVFRLCAGFLQVAFTITFAFLALESAVELLMLLYMAVMGRIEHFEVLNKSRFWMLGSASLQILGTAPRDSFEIIQTARTQCAIFFIAIYAISGYVIPAVFLSIFKVLGIGSFLTAIFMGIFTLVELLVRLWLCFMIFYTIAIAYT